MTDAVPMRFHAAIFTSTDPAACTTLLVGGPIDMIQANVPAGGCWRFLPAGVHRARDCPPLGELPVSVVPLRAPPPVSPKIDSGVVMTSPALPAPNKEAKA